MNLPNFISLGRLFLTPLLICLIVVEELETAFWVFLIAGVSDILDGLLARLLKDQTVIGRYLDPLADKVLLIAVFLTLGAKGYIPAWLVVLAVFRDIMILGGTLLLFVFHRTPVIKPIFISKLNTFLQILVVALVLGLRVLDKKTTLPLALPLESLFLLTGATVIISGVVYVIKWIRELNDNGRPISNLV
jgi:cardiolipin synthase